MQSVVGQMYRGADYFREAFLAAGAGYPLKAPPVQIAHPAIGPIGSYERGKVHFKLGSRSLNALLRDEAGFTARQARRRQVRLAIEKYGQPAATVVAALLGIPMGSITTWDGVVQARGIGRFYDFAGVKASQTTVASNWSIFTRSTGIPGAAAYTAIPGGAVMNRASTGAWPIANPDTPASQKAYLQSLGLNHLTGTNVVLMADLQAAAGGIDANIATSQTVNSAALTRYTAGEGVMWILDVTTALGAGAANVTLTYTNQAGTGSRSSGAIAMTASAITFRAQPVLSGIFGPLQATDYGIRSVQSIQFSAGMGAGSAVALLLYKPLQFMPTLVTTSYVELSPAEQLGALTELPVGSDNQVGFLTFFVLTSTTSTGVQTIMTREVWG